MTSAASVMDPHPTFLKPSDAISKAAQYIMENRCRNLPVVDADGCYLGTFSVNCLLKMVLPKSVLMEKGLKNISFIHETLADLHERFRALENQDIAICINKDAPTVTPDTPLLETLLLLHDMRMSIPVLEPGTCKLLGVVSYWDVGRRILSA